MCGIAGAVALREGLEPIGLEPLARMAGALRHRGPEESGAYRDERAGLAHARLSIIDLTTGSQPLANEGRARSLRSVTHCMGDPLCCPTG